MVSKVHVIVVKPTAVRGVPAAVGDHLTVDPDTARALISCNKAEICAAPEPEATTPEITEKTESPEPEQKRRGRKRRSDTNF
jgi:hypothetical protein